MKKIYLAAGVVLAAGTIVAGLSRHGLTEELSSSSGPRYTSDGKLMRPANYREWVYVSSGLGMNYGPAAGGAPAFTNVFVAPAAYKSYMASGRWPDKTMFVLEAYSASSHGSIVKQGHFQDALLAVEAEVKDEQRFPEKWAYFGFGVDGKTGEKIPQGHCWTCHNQNAAVENSFVQFYPTLLKVAYQKDTIKPSIHLEPGVARIQEMILDQGWAGVQPVLDHLRSVDPGAEVLKEPNLNALGYRLLSAGKNNDAVAVFERAVKDYPDSPNAYDSLADGYVAAGDKAKAMESSKKALDLLPKATGLSANQAKTIEDSAKQRIAKLKS